MRRPTIRFRSAAIHRRLLRMSGCLWCLLLLTATAAAAAAPLRLPDPNALRYKPLAFELPRAERITLENGIVLHVLPDRELPLVKFKVVVRAGSMYDPPGREGMADLAAGLLATGGIAGQDGDSVDLALESMAASFHASANRETAIVSFSVLKKDLRQGFDLFTRILTAPAFEERKLALAKELKLEELRRIFDDPQKLAFREFGRLMHRGTPRGGVATAASVRAIGRDELSDWHGRFYNPQNMMIAISGDIGLPELADLIGRSFAHWRPAAPAPPPVAAPGPQKAGIYFLVKEVPQSIVVFGWLAPAKTAPEYYPFTLLDFIVGSGGFRSRIFQEIRTNLGLAYSTGSFYNPKQDHGLFAAYAMTKTASTGQVVSRIAEILREIGEKPVPPGEIEGAKRAIQNSFIFSFTSAEQVAFQQLMLEHDRLPADHLERYRERIERVRAADLRDAAHRVSPQDAVLLIVGNEETCREIEARFGGVTRIAPLF